MSLGAHDWTARHVRYSRVANISLHPRFHWRGLRVHHLPEDDLAILTLAQDTPFSASVRPVCLPAARSWKDYSGGPLKCHITKHCSCPGEVGTISGWGLQYTEPGGQGSQPGVLQVGSHLEHGI